MMRMLALVALLARTAHGHDDSGRDSGSFFIVYAGDAPESCIVPAGSMMVDDTCCTGPGEPAFGLIVDTFPSTCFVIEGLLGEDGGSLQSYLGCDGDNLTPTYGEGCFNNGENGGIIPPGTVVNDTNATDIAECGCTFQVTGNGCHKIRDFSALPGFENDTRQVFLYMNETCTDDSSSSSDDSAAFNDHLVTVSTLLGTATVTMFAMVFLV